ncbi:MAG: hypothetical protein ACJ74Q_14000 [Pyrinomonadaceae bacterium]
MRRMLSGVGSNELPSGMRARPACLASAERGRLSISFAFAGAA